ncbi:MAG: phage portal protein [bacterium]
MGFFDRFRKKQDQQPKMFKRSYSAASTGRLFSDFKASDGSADKDLETALKNLRNRSRDLARNNEYVKRYLNLMKTNIIGSSGFNVQVKAIDSTGRLDMSGNQAVEDAFAQWGRLGNCTVDGKLTWVDAQKLALETIIRDGELFVVKHRGSSFKDTFAIEFIEADQIDEKKTEKLKGGSEIRMGIEFDRFKKPVAYHIKSSHPGDYHHSTHSSSETVRIPADRIFHVYMPLRAGQSRGEPWLAPAMSAIKQLGAFREAAIVNARIGASKMGFFTSPAGDGFVADDMDGNVPIMEVEPGTMHQLPNGIGFEKFDPDFPSNEFDVFHKSVLRGIASGLGVSYTALSNDLEATSYSSIRQGALEERDFYKDIQSFMIDHFIRPVFEAWLSAAMEMNSFGIPIRQYNRFAAKSHFRGKAWNWVDPFKEMNAAVTGLKNGILSIEDVASQYGKDSEELMSQIQRDRLLAEQFGIKYALEPYGASFTPVIPDVSGD